VIKIYFYKYLLSFLLLFSCGPIYSDCIPGKPHDSSFVSSTVHDLAVVKGSIIAVDNRGHVLGSRDGVNWKLLHDGGNEAYYSIAVRDETIVVNGFRSILTKTMGNDWVVTDFTYSSSLRRSTIASNEFLMYSHTELWRSDDGLKWDKTLSMSSGLIRGVHAVGDRLFILVDVGSVYTITDQSSAMEFIEWDYKSKGLPISTATNGEDVAVVTDSGFYVGKWNDALQSVIKIDGLADFYIRKVAYLQDEFIVVGDCGLFMTSKGAHHWKKHDLASTQDLFTAEKTESGYIVAGASPLDSVTAQVGTFFVNTGEDEWKRVDIPYYGLD